jgi:hypothetical protein
VSGDETNLWNGLGEDGEFHDACHPTVGDLLARMRWASDVCDAMNAIEAIIDAEYIRYLCGAGWQRERR